MNAPHSLLRLFPWAVVALSAALVLLLAQRHRDLTRAYSELRRSTVFLRAGDVVPTFTTTTLDGAPITVGSAASQDTRQVLFVLRTTCPYCVATLPVWRRLADSLTHLSGHSTQVLLVSLDSAGATRAYVRAHRLTYPTVLFPERKLVRLYRVAATPQTVVLNAEGRVLYARTGLLDTLPVLDSVFRAATAPTLRDALSLAATRVVPRTPGARPQ